MRRFNLLLSLKHPKVDFATAKNNIIRPLVEVKRSQHVIRPVAHLVSDSLDAKIVMQMPDLNHFIGAQGNQVVPFIVHGQVLDGGGVPRQVSLSHEGERVPQNNLTLLSTRGDDLVLGRIHESIHTFLMQVEGSPFFVGERADVMNMDAAIEGGADQVLNVRVVFYLRDPTTMTLFVDHLHIANMLLVLARIYRL